ncbi:hypothetical protein [Nonomuraea sp. NPDC050643]|uniref:hypothetical protein n=1 Tax=Nonomuraea sp. NPDC050643 TaxID=3155660 RepID=UPI0033F4B7B7
MVGAQQAHLVALPQPGELVAGAQQDARRAGAGPVPGDGVRSRVSPSGPMTCAVVPAKPSMTRIGPGLTCGGPQVTAGGAVAGEQEQVIAFVRLPFLTDDPERGALSLLNAATQDVPGNSYVGPGKAGLDQAMAGRLWEATADLVGAVAR